MGVHGDYARMGLVSRLLSDLLELAALPADAAPGGGGGGGGAAAAAPRPVVTLGCFQVAGADAGRDLLAVPTARLAMAESEASDACAAGTTVLAPSAPAQREPPPRHSMGRSRKG
jgi:hypothetical protein